MDRTFDRIPSRPDPIRATAFNVAAVLDGLQPRSYRWNVPQVLDQGPDGACCGFAFTHEAIARPVPVTTWPRPGFTSRDAQAFAFELYKWAQRNDPWPGESYSGTSVAAAAKGMAAAGLIGEYRWTTDADDLATAVSRRGPAVIGVNWYAGMSQPDSKGWIRPVGRLLGGHAILVNGYSVRLRAFRLHNSWGPDWSDRGEAWLGHDDMTGLLNLNGEACVPTQRLP